MVIDRYKDMVERVGWTFAQAFVGYLLANVAVDQAVKWTTVLYGALLAGGISAGKVFVAQRAGSNSDGAAIPGGIEQKAAPKRPRKRPPPKKSP